MKMKLNFVIANVKKATKNKITAFVIEIFHDNTVYLKSFISKDFKMRYDMTSLINVICILQNPMSNVMISRILST